jgi:hypothetical protein
MHKCCVSHQSSYILPPPVWLIPAVYDDMARASLLCVCLNQADASFCRRRESLRRLKESEEIGRSVDLEDGVLAGRVHTYKPS